MPTIFLAGIYGVGKSTLAQQISSKTGIPNYSAGDLISSINGEKYGANKVVTNKDKNQDILANRVTELLRVQERIILAGHFCIVDKEGRVDKLPKTVFQKLQIDCIVLLEASPEIIYRHLSGRDGKNYPIELIQNLLTIEREEAMSTATQLPCPLFMHPMQYSVQDIEEIEKILHSIIH